MNDRIDREPEELRTAPAALDPEIERFVRAMSAAWARHGNLALAAPPEARRIAEIVREPWTRGGPAMASIRERTLPTDHGSVRVRIYQPRDAADQPALVYLHGGGWTLFSIDTHDRIMREYAARAEVAVIGVDYALSPEAKYPVALDQVVSVATFLAERGAALGVDPARLAIGGDSAGANLAIAAALRLRDQRRPHALRAMVLNYGVFDRWSSIEAQERFGGEGNMLTAAEMENFWRNYLREERDSESPYAAPIRADLRGLPPAFLAVPELDLLAEQSFAMAGRLGAAGVPVALKTYRGATHSFLEAVSISSLAGTALDDAASWLRPILATPEEEP